MKNDMKNDSVVETKFTIFESILMMVARVREIKGIRYSKYAESGNYVLGQYKNSLSPAAQAELDIENGLVGREYLVKALSKPPKRHRGFNRHQR